MDEADLSLPARLVRILANPAYRRQDGRVVLQVAVLSVDRVLMEEAVASLEDRDRFIVEDSADILPDGFRVFNRQTEQWELLPIATPG